MFQSISFVIPQQCFQNASCAEFSNELLRIGLDISKNLLHDKDFPHFFMGNENVNIVSKMLDCMSIDPLSIIFNESHNHNETMQTMASILIKTSTVSSTVDANVVPRFLVKELMQRNNVFAGYILIDLWNAWSM